MPVARFSGIWDKLCSYTGIILVKGELMPETLTNLQFAVPNVGSLMNARKPFGLEENLKIHLVLKKANVH